MSVSLVFARRAAVRSLPSKVAAADGGIAANGAATRRDEIARGGA
jgi:hypothetical protein